MSSASSPGHVLLLSIPGLRQEDLSRMPTLQSLAAGGDCVPLAPGFPAVTCPVEATLTTGARCPPPMASLPTASTIAARTISKCGLVPTACTAPRGSGIS